MIFQDTHYQELIAAIEQWTAENQGEGSGVVEISDLGVDFVLGFEFCGGRLVRWIGIAFENGRRVGSDFDVNRLGQWL